MVVIVTTNTADVSIQWMNKIPVYPNLIQIFCSNNSTDEELDFCGETSNTQEKITIIKNLSPNVTYYFKLKAFGELPFVIQGYFTTTPFMGMQCVLYIGIYKYEGLERWTKNRDA